MRSAADVRPRSADQEYGGPPASTFLSAEWHERDLQACFRPRWLVAGHVDELARPHGYLTFRLGEEEAIVRRGDDGRLHGFRNYCPHRGTRLCTERLGVSPSRRIVCPYHSWVFSTEDGSLLQANNMHEDFDRSIFGLKPVHVAEWNGLVFVCLAQTPPPPPADYLAELEFAGRDFSRMKLAHLKTHEVHANWKIVVENNSECYHCAANHPELRVVYDWKSLYTSEEEFVRYCADREHGLEVWQMPVRSYHTVGGRQVVSRPTPRLEGADTEPDDEWGTYVGWEPGVALNVSRDMFWLFVPKPTGPRTTELTQMWLVHEDAQPGRDYDLESLIEFWDLTMGQDRELCEGVQRGMAEPTYTPGPLNRRHQRGQAGFYRWYAAQIRRQYDGLDPHDA